MCGTIAESARWCGDWIQCGGQNQSKRSKISSGVMFNRFTQFHGQIFLVSQFDGRKQTRPIVRWSKMDFFHKTKAFSSAGDEQQPHMTSSLLKLPVIAVGAFSLMAMYSGKRSRRKLWRTRASFSPESHDSHGYTAKRWIIKSRLRKQIFLINFCTNTKYQDGFVCLHFS